MEKNDVTKWFFLSNSYFNERRYIGYLFCYFWIILLECVLFIYVCNFVRVYIAVFYWFFEKFKEISQIMKKRTKRWIS